MPNADSYQPGHQHGDMYAQFRLKSTWPSAYWLVFPVQTQANLVISMVACLPNTVSNQPGYQPSGMYAKCSLKSMVISEVACVPNSDSNQPDHQHGDMVCPMQSQINLAIGMVACMKNVVLINLVIIMVARMPYAVSNQPDHQHGGMYAQFRLKFIWPLA